MHSADHVVREGREILEVLEAAPVGMIKVDARGTILMTNRELERMFGYPREKLIGASLNILIPERYHAAHAGHLRAYAQSPSTRAMGVGRELFGRRSDGTEFPIDVALNHVGAPGGHAVIASVIDVTRPRQDQAELQRLNSSLEEKNAELERFVFTVSHDLKSPIVTILGYVAHLKSDLEEGTLSDFHEYSDRIQAAAERMKQKIEDLLRLSRVGRENLEPRLSRIEGIVRSVVEGHREALDARAVEIDLLLEAKEVWCDPQHFEQVLENLVGNSVRYGCGGNSPRIKIATRSVEGGVELSVDDNGNGIEPKYAEKVFELFQRLTTEGDGTGVGLAIVRRIATWYGGRAWVIATPGEGAKFRVFFPVGTKGA